MARTTSTIALLCVLGMAALAQAQLQVCDNKKRIGSVSGYQLKETKFLGNGKSSMTVAWARPNDGANGALPACINEYVVSVAPAGAPSQILQTSSVSVSPVQTSASWTFDQAVPGKAYTFSVYGRNPSLGASGNGQNLRSPEFTAASAPAAPACRQPQSVSNIRRGTAVNNGAKATMTIEWDAPANAAGCVAEYSVDVYPAGKTAVGDRLRTATVKGTSFTDSNFEAGKSYEFYIYARNPSLGAMGNGVGLRSQPIMAPVGVTTGRRML